MSQQCQHSGPGGQCSHTRVDGSDFCLRHSNESSRIRSYRLSDTDLRARFDHMAGSDSLETVRKEVVLQRAMIDKRLDLARTEAEYLVAFQAIQPAMTTLNKLVESLNKLEMATHTVLGKAALDKVASEIGIILVEELANVDGAEDIIDRVATRISDAISEARNE